MGIENKNSDRSKDVKLAQILHCQRVRPWLKSTGPRSPEGKLKVLQNLPHQKSKIAKVCKGLVKLDEALRKLERLESRIKKRQATAIEKLEKLAKKGEK
jgi:hypothetical protein